MEVGVWRLFHRTTCNRATLSQHQNSSVWRDATTVLKSVYMYNIHSLATSLGIPAPWDVCGTDSVHMRSRCVTAAEEHMVCQSCQQRTGNWGYGHHGLLKLDNRRCLCRFLSHPGHFLSKWTFFCLSLSLYLRDLFSSKTTKREFQISFNPWWDSPLRGASENLWPSVNHLIS